MPVIAMRITQSEILPAIKRLGPALQLSLIGTLSGLLLLWNLIINLTNSSDPAPLPYIPFINPVDLTQIAFFVLVLGSLKLVKPSMKIQRDQIVIILAGLCFVWLSAVLIRSMHHYLDIRFDLSAMSVDTRVQSAISILWTVIGMGAMLFASRNKLRPLWVVGAALVGVVLVKCSLSISAPAAPSNASFHSSLLAACWSLPDTSHRFQKNTRSRTKNW